VYFTDRGIEELDDRRGEEQVTLGWLAARLQAFADLHPEFDAPVGRLVVNCTEGAPGSFRDKMLMIRSPYLILSLAAPATQARGR
jgi:hypothetical protein